MLGVQWRACLRYTAALQEATDIYKALLLDHRELLALNVYVALCYAKLDYYDVSQEILQVSGWAWEVDAAEPLQPQASERQLCTPVILHTYGHSNVGTMNNWCSTAGCKRQPAFAESKKGTCNM